MIKIGDKVEISNGYAFKSSKYVEQGIRVVRITNVQKGEIQDDNPKFYSSDTKEELKSYLINEGDILMSLTGNVGRVGVFPKEYCPAYLNQRVARIRVKSQDLFQKYLFYMLNSEFFERDAIFNSSGIAQLNLSTKWVSEYKIPLPLLDQQKKIAAILDAADAYRQKTKALIEKYDQLTQSLFLDMFGDPVTNPKGWEKIEFSNVAINMNSKRIPIKQADREQMQGDYPYYGATGIVDYINDFKFDGEFLLIAEDGKNLVNRKKPIAWTVNGQFWVNNHSHVVKYNGVSNLTFLAFQLNRTNISQYVTGIDQFKMNKSNLNRIPISTPPLTLQNQFAERVQAIEVQKAQAQSSLTQAEDLFNSLLQRAFKGELV
tara:strand:+ start:294 stop:1415 length:1122 start_codon:yes stop_codon:yes gene_type:complete